MLQQRNKFGDIVLHTDDAALILNNLVNCNSSDRNLVVHSTLSEPSLKEMGLFPFSPRLKEGERKRMAFLNKSATDSLPSMDDRGHLEAVNVIVVLFHEEHPYVLLADDPDKQVRRTLSFYLSRENMSVASHVRSNLLKELKLDFSHVVELGNWLSSVLFYDMLCMRKSHIVFASHSVTDTNVWNRLVLQSNIMIAPLSQIMFGYTDGLHRTHHQLLRSVLSSGKQTYRINHTPVHWNRDQLFRVRKQLWSSPF